MKHLCNFLFLIRLAVGTEYSSLLLALLLTSFAHMHIAYAESDSTPRSGERVESVIYPGDDTTKAEPELPPSFSLNLAPVVEAKLPNTLSADELRRLRPRPDFTPLGVHRVLHDRVRLVEFSRNGRMIDRTQALTRQAEREASGLIINRASNNKASAKDVATDRPNLRLPSPRAQEAPPHNIYSLVEGAWQTTAAGSLWRMQITAPAARALRLHFKDFNVGTGRVWIYASSQNSLKQKAYGPYTARGIYDDGDFWSDIVFHNSLTIEYSPDPDRPHAKAVPFRIHKVSHLTRLPFGDTASRHDPRSTSSTASYRGGGAADDTHRLEAFDRDGSLYSGAANSAYGGTLYDGNAYDHGGMSQSQAERTAYSYGGMLSEMAASLVDIPQRNIAACHNDVSCHTQWSQSASGVGMIIISKDGGTLGQCSGALINVTRDIGYIPYFLTAAHCVTTNSEARSVIVYWKYKSSYCNASTYGYRYNPTSRGATLLATTGDSETETLETLARGDATFLKLAQQPPRGVAYLGWWATNMQRGRSLAIIHHPDQASQRISFGKTHTSLPDLGHLSSFTLSDGVIENGSSGSPFFYTKDGKQYVVGVLSAGSPALCSTDQEGSLSKLNSFFPSIRRWLRPDLPADDDPPAAVHPTVSLTASSRSIQSGQSVTLSWSSTKAERVALNCSNSSNTYNYNNVHKNDSWTTSRFTADTTCRITATSSTGHTATDSVRIRVISVPEPKILSFTASPSSINAGERVTFRWSTRNAQTVAFRCDSHPDTGLRFTNSNVSSGTWSTTVFTLSTICHLTAINANGRTVVASVNVRIRPPEITSFTASPSSIVRGESVTLMWSSRKATSAFISNSSDNYNLSSSVSTSGSIVIRPYISTTYRLSVHSSSGSTHKDVHVHVHTGSGNTGQAIRPTVSLSASSYSIQRGESTTLHWSLTNSELIRVTSIYKDNGRLSLLEDARWINDDGTPLSSYEVYPIVTTTYRVTITSSTGHTASDSVQIRVNPPITTASVMRPTVNLTASPRSIRQGQGVTFKWSSINAARVILQPDVSNGFVDIFNKDREYISGGAWWNLDLYDYKNGRSNVTDKGSYTVYPTASVTYLAMAISPTGHTARDSVRVIVNGSSTPDRTNDNDDDDNTPNRDPTTGLFVKISASPKIVKRGGCTLLGWRSENAASLYIDGLGGVSSTGVREECNLQRTTTFRITATHSSGVRVSSSVRVVVTD